MASPTRIFSHFAADLRFEHLTLAESHAATRHLLDTIGAAVSGSPSDVTQLAAGLMNDVGRLGNVPTLGLGRRYDALTAAWLGGASAHGLEVDDGYRAGSVHPGAVVVPAVFSAGYGSGVSGQRLLTAVAVGYELSTRLAEAIHPASRERGFHNTPVVGVLAAAAAVASLRGLSADRVEHALGIAASSAAGLFAFLSGGGEIKRLHAGFAAREGLQAALLAERGMKGPKGVLEGADGFFQAYCGVPVSDALTDGLWPRNGETPLNITRCYMKPYACCRHIHPAIDAVLNIMQSGNLTAEDIERVTVGTYEIAARHVRGHWKDFAAAQLSYQFCVATAVRHGEVSIARFHPACLADPLTNDLCKRIEVHVDETCQRTYPALRSANVTVTAKDGRMYRSYIDEPRGSARHPLSDSDLLEKYRSQVIPVLGPEQTDRSIQLTISISTLHDIDELVQTLALPGEPF